MITITFYIIIIIHYLMICLRPKLAIQCDTMPEKKVKSNFSVMSIKVSVHPSIVTITLKTKRESVDTFIIIALATFHHY